MPRHLPLLSSRPGEETARGKYQPWQASTDDWAGDRDSVTSPFRLDRSSEPDLDVGNRRVSRKTGHRDCKRGGTLHRWVEIRDGAAVGVEVAGAGRADDQILR